MEREGRFASLEGLVCAFGDSSTLGQRAFLLNNNNNNIAWLAANKITNLSAAFGWMTGWLVYCFLVATFEPVPQSLSFTHRLRWPNKQTANNILAV